jgi:hypothetical protein
MRQGNLIRRKRDGETAIVLANPVFSIIWTSGVDTGRQSNIHLDQEDEWEVVEDWVPHSYNDLSPYFKLAGTVKMRERDVPKPAIDTSSLTETEKALLKKLGIKL